MPFVEDCLTFFFESKFTAKTGDEVDELNLVFKQNAYYKTIEFQESHRCALFQYLINYDREGLAVDQIYVPSLVVSLNGRTNICLETM